MYRIYRVSTLGTVIFLVYKVYKASVLGAVTMFWACSGNCDCGFGCVMYKEFLY